MVPIVSIVSAVPNHPIQVPFGNTDSPDTVGHHKMPGVFFVSKKCPSVSSIYGAQSTQSDLCLSMTQCIINYLNLKYLI